MVSFQTRRICCAIGVVMMASLMCEAFRTQLQHQEVSKGMHEARKKDVAEEIEDAFNTAKTNWEGTKDDQKPTFLLKDCTSVSFFSDLEGNYGAWDKFKVGNNIDNHLKLKKGQCVVYGGDALDSAQNQKKIGCKPVTIVKELVNLYNRNKGQVMLILGNRDLNKLRLKTELAEDSQPKDFPYYWAGPAAWKTGPAIGKRLEEIMAKSMGANIAGIMEDPEATVKDKKKKTKRTKEEVAEYVRDVLLDKDAPENWWYQFLQKGVVVGAAQIGDDYAVYSHTGLHPFMFGGEAGQFKVPTHAGLLKDAKGKWAGDNVNGLSTSTDGGIMSVQERLDNKVQRDNFQYQLTDSTVADWVEQYAAWKTLDFRSWSEASASGWTAQNRPGLQLMDAGLGNIVNRFSRNAGFTTGGPCSAWEYGVNMGPEKSNGMKAANVYHSPEFYDDVQSPGAFGAALKNMGITFLFNGHFTEPDKSIPERFYMGEIEQSPIVHNHDLSKASWDEQASWSIFEAGASVTYMPTRTEAAVALTSPTEGEVGTSLQIVEHAKWAQKCLGWDQITKIDKTSSIPLGFSAAQNFNMVDEQYKGKEGWLAFVENAVEMDDGKKYVVLKFLMSSESPDFPKGPPFFGFTWLQKAQYGLMLKTDFEELKEK